MEVDDNPRVLSAKDSFYFREGETVMSEYQNAIDQVATLKSQYNGTWDAISPDFAARMVVQNRFKTGLDVAKYTAKIMRQDMAEYDADCTQYTQSLGCWHGFVGQQKMLSVKKHQGTTSKSFFICLAGWLPHCVLSSAHCRISQCTRKPQLPH